MAAKKKVEKIEVHGPPDGSEPELPDPEALRPWYEVADNPEKMA